ncbi:TetR/AcrR family transcriptional regulator [Mycobacterium sp. UM_Kg1]|uniref:TetR/AcrR family transcriptional regulator n=1 Tax=Mycobacterium sp. UM_Kg1 TaxID=1545691 RepID=UPI000A8E0B48|nr:TetR/AcrR family transcriptional regulator [Mycobacterium sp. UM_Kg1]
MQIVGTEGSDALVVRSICRVANVSPRKFYESFPDTDALLIATYERAVEELLRTVTAAVPGEPMTSDPRQFRSRFRAVFEAATLFLDQNPRAGRIIFQEALHNDVLRARAMNALPMFLKTIRRAVTSPDHQPIPPTQAHLEATLLSGALTAVLGEWTSGASPWTREDVVAYCTEAGLAILAIKL